MRTQSFNDIPVVVKNLIIINALIFVFTYLLGLVKGVDINNYLALYYPSTTPFQPWQFVTYMFAHGGLFHILMNMLGLWMFGSELEMMWGSKRFFNFYMISGLGAAIFYVLIGYLTNNFNPMLGASGAVMGIILGYGLTFPNRELMFLFVPFPIKAKYFILIYAAYELYAGLFRNDGVAHFAHLGGMITGLILFLIWKKR